jgi:hypothetical protein
MLSSNAEEKYKIEVPTASKYAFLKNYDYR